MRTCHVTSLMLLSDFQRRASAWQGRGDRFCLGVESAVDKRPGHSRVTPATSVVMTTCPAAPILLLSKEMPPSRTLPLCPSFPLPLPLSPPSSPSAPRLLPHCPSAILPKCPPALLPHCLSPSLALCPCPPLSRAPKLPGLVSAHHLPGAHGALVRTRRGDGLQHPQSE